jgi:hypothetical protein
MKNSKTWRDFEELVARIEKAAAPRGAVVRSPDRIRDLVTGRAREVDASIRMQVGTADVLITVECRKRGRRDDDTWIEQLGSKRQKIGAAKTIAVSASGFTESAVRAAKHFGIELRTLSQVSPSDIEGWFLPGGAVHVFRLIEDLRCSVTLFEPGGQPSEYGFWLHDNDIDIDTPLFACEWIQSPFPARVLLSVLERAHPEMFFDAVPFDGSRVEKEFPIEWQQGDLFLDATPERMPVAFTNLIASVSYQSAVCRLDSGVHHEYRSEGGVVVQHTSFSTELLGSAVTFEHQSRPDGKHAVRLRFAPKQ